MAKELKGKQPATVDDLNDLAAMMQRGLSESEERLTKRIDDLQEGQTGLQNGQTSILQAVENISLKLSAYIGQWGRDFDRLDGQVQEHEEKIKKLNSRVARK